MSRSRGAAQAAVRLAKKSQVVLAVTRPECHQFFWVFGKMFRGKLPDEVMQIIAPRPASSNQRFRHQCGKRCERRFCHDLGRLHAGNHPGTL